MSGPPPAKRPPQFRTRSPRRRGNVAFRWRSAAIAAALAAASSCGGSGTHEAAASAAGPLLQRGSGSGDKAEPRFVVPPAEKGWGLSYRFRCTGGAAAYFAIAVSVSPGQMDSPIHGPTVNATHGSGTATYQNTGPFYLQVISECAWSYRVNALVTG